MNKNFLYTLLDSMSVSGHEIPLQKKVIEEMTPFCDEIRTDYTGNVFSILNPDAPFKVLLTGHIDEIGLVVTYIQSSGLLRVTRAGGIGFDNVPVDGSTKMDDTLMESIEPFRIEDAVDFQTAYLSGYLADKYDVDAEASIGRANDRIKQSTEDAFASTVVGYTTVVPTSTNIQLENGRARYALYPVWILNTKWNGQNFTFAVNGQTGKIAGDLPMDKGLFWKYLLGITGAVSAVSFLLSFLLLGL